MNNIDSILSIETDCIVTTDIAFLLGMSIDDTKQFILGPIKNEAIINEISEWLHMAKDQMVLIEQFAVGLLESHNDLINRVRELEYLYLKQS